jgi:Holliday junction resolvase
MERKLQSQIIKWLRSEGCYVLNIQPVTGIPTGCPDIIGFKEGFWFALEIKSSEKSHKQPLQFETVKKLDNWSYCRFVYPANWGKIKAELQLMLD